MTKNEFAFMLMVALCTIFYSCQKQETSILSEDEEEQRISAKSIEVIGNWETGNALQWNGIVAKDVAAQFYVGTASEQPVRQGTYSARIIVRPGDQVGTSSGERCEPDHFHDSWNNYYQEEIDDEFYYGWSNYFPTSWTNPTGWGVIFQTHHTNPINPPVAVNVGNDTLGLNLMTGKATKGATRNTYGHQKFYLIKNTLSKGFWNDFILRIKFRPDSTGLVEVWHRVNGQTQFSKVVSAINVPTMQYTDDPNLFDPNYEDAHPYLPGYFTGPTWLRNGLYRGAGGTNTNVLFHDNFSKGTTYASVAGTF